MQRRNRPVPIAVPQEDTPHDFKLTDSGVFETGGIVVSKAGCIIKADVQTSVATALLSRPASVGKESTPEQATGNHAAAPAAADQQRPRSGSKAASADTPAEATTADNSSSSTQAAIVLDDLQELCVIGSGSSGVVKKVRHKPTGNVYVLKVINFDMGSEQVRRQVTTEVKALDGSRHPHIVQYHQSYFANGALTILMEFMDGGSLWDVLQKIRIVPQQYLPELARQVLSGLSYLHDTARICHRDIKPGNLLLSSSGQLKISDFGVSSQLSNSMSRCLSWVGTVTYMSPERIRGDSYSFNTDVWSVGLLLLECATGRYPYPPESGATAAGPPRLGFWELLEYIVVEPAPKLPADQFSVEFTDFLGYCLQKDPAKRPSAGLLLQHPFITRGARTNLSDLLRLPQVSSNKSRAATGVRGSRSSSDGGLGLNLNAGGLNTSSSASKPNAGVSNGSSSSSGTADSQGRGAVARNSSTRYTNSSSSGSSRVGGTGAAAAVTAAAAAVGARPSSAALAGKLAPYITTYQSRPVSAGVATVVKTAATPPKPQQQQQQLLKQPSTPSIQQQQQLPKQPSTSSIQQQQQQHTPPRPVGPQQQARQMSPRLMQQQQPARQQSPRLQQPHGRPPGLVIGNQQQQPQQQQSPLRPLTQPMATAATGTPSSAGPLTAQKPKTTPRKTPVVASSGTHH